MANTEKRTVPKPEVQKTDESSLHLYRVGLGFSVAGFLLGYELHLGQENKI